MARNGPSLGQIRQYVVAALQADATVTALVGSRVYDNRCLEPQQGDIPCAIVYVRSERGTYNGYASLAPNFATEWDIEVELHVKGASDTVVAQNAEVTEAIQNAILGNETLGRYIDGWTRYDRDADIGTDKTDRRAAVARVRLTCQGQVAYSVGA